MPSSNVTLEGLPLSVLKQKAAYSQDPNASLADLIHQAHQVYSSAVQADSLDQTELAYVHYFKAAGVLQVILKHPGFPSFKTQNPSDHRVYLGEDCPQDPGLYSESKATCRDYRESTWPFDSHSLLTPNECGPNSTDWGWDFFPHQTLRTRELTRKKTYHSNRSRPTSQSGLISIIFSHPSP